MRPHRINIDDFPSIVDTLLQRHKSHAYKDAIIANDEFSLISSDQMEANRLLINCPELVTSQENFVLFGDVQRGLIDTIKEILEPKGYVISDDTELFLLDAKKENNLPDIPPLPVGYRPRTLSIQDADLIGSCWFQVPGTDQYIKDLLENYLNVAVETESGELVGWMLEHPFGAHGVLHTLEAHRRKGLGKYLTTSLRDLFLAKDKPSYMHIAQDNTASLKLAKSSGFQVVNYGEDHEHIFLSFLKKVPEC